jgi:C4-dicarboxylate-specific signal transduction histidine kinase
MVDRDGLERDPSRARLVKDFGDAPVAQGNESRLGQVLVNLLINAAQATP